MSLRVRLFCATGDLETWQVSVMMHVDLISATRFDRIVGLCMPGRQGFVRLCRDPNLGNCGPTWEASGDAVLGVLTVRWAAEQLPQVGVVQASQPGPRCSLCLRPSATVA